MKLSYQVQLCGVLMLVASRASGAQPTTPECLAASESSLSLRGQHKLREARAQLLICSEHSCPSDIRRDCVRRVDEINAAIPTIVFEIKDAAGDDLTEVKVRVDGEPLAQRLDGSALSIDPGPHAFAFEAGGRSVQKQFVIREGEKERRERIVLAAPVVAPAPRAPPALGAPAIAASPSAETPPAVDGSSGGPRLGGARELALVAAGLGVVSAAIGIAFGLEARSKHDEATKLCPGPQCATEPGVTKWNEAVTAGTLSTMGFAVGALGLVGGALLWFTAPSERSATPSTQVGFGPANLRVRRTW